MEERASRLDYIKVNRVYRIIAEQSERIKKKISCYIIAYWIESGQIRSDHSDHILVDWIRTNRSDWIKRIISNIEDQI